MSELVIGYGYNEVKGGWIEVFQHPLEYNLNEGLDSDGYCDSHNVYTEGCDEDCRYVDGIYYWPCFPGCLPDGEPVGAFDSLEVLNRLYFQE